MLLSCKNIILLLQLFYPLVEYFIKNVEIVVPKVAATYFTKFFWKKEILKNNSPFTKFFVNQKNLATHAITRPRPQTRPLPHMAGVGPSRGRSGTPSAIPHLQPSSSSDRGDETGSSCVSSLRQCRKLLRNLKKRSVLKRKIASRKVVSYDVTYKMAESWQLCHVTSL